MIPRPTVPLVLIVSGPAGSGKTTLRERLIEACAPNLRRVVTATTRPPREGEVNGVDYHFLSRAAFEQGIERQEFYEYAIVHGMHYYGGLKSEFRDRLAEGLDLIMNVDVQGAATYRQAERRDPVLSGRLVTVFLMPESLEQLRQRLLMRDAGQEADVERRLKTAVEEVQQWNQFDYCFTCGTREEDFARLLTIYRAEKMRVRRTG